MHLQFVAYQMEACVKALTQVRPLNNAHKNLNPSVTTIYSICYDFLPDFSTSECMCFTDKKYFMLYANFLVPIIIWSVKAIRKHSNQPNISRN